MKKEIKNLAAYFRCTTHYSGKTRTMYIKGENAAVCVLSIINNINPIFNLVKG
jgi:hypothetical protein